MSRCALCDKLTSDEELKADKDGWKRFAPACRKCMSHVRPKENSKYAPLFVSELVKDEDETDE